jgi:DNA-binding beta-propeller fold protein YncE
LSTTGRALRNIVVLAVTLSALAGAMARTAAPHLATATIAASRWPYLPGSLLPLNIEGLSAPYHVEILGPGRLLPPNTYELPDAQSAGSTLLVAGNAAALATRRVRIGSVPRADRPLLLVACYEDGLVLHHGRRLSVAGILGTGGAPSDVAIDRLGRAAVTDTQGTSLTILRLLPWSVSRIAGVVTGDDVAIDESTHAFFVTDREWNGTGALTRIGFDGSVVRVVTGETAEGLVVDERRQIVYVANANDGTIAFVDARSMQVVRRFPAVPRVFALALSPDGERLYATSNEAADSPFRTSGRAIAIALDRQNPLIVARSASLVFPVGIALDDRTKTLFVSDEERNEIDVLDARTLRAKHVALPTCGIPWKLTVDGAADRLYVPCAGDNAIDVFDARTLHRVAGAPFATGGYPLAIAVWRP